VPGLLQFHRQPPSVESDHGGDRIAKLGELVFGPGRAFKIAHPPGGQDQVGSVIGKEPPICRVRGICDQGLSLPLDGLSEPEEAPGYSVSHQDRC
jgi:hypothetical protein